MKRLEFIVNELSVKEQEALVKDIGLEMDVGLGKPDQTLRMLHSYVNHYPTGHECGDYLSIDLGGSNLRVMHVQLLGKAKFMSEYRKWTVPDELKKGIEGHVLFDWIASCVLQYCEGKSGIEFNNCIGFCFSFPIHQLSLNSAIMLQWNKEFDIPGVVGKDVAELLNHAFSRLGSMMRVGAIINDTVAVLLARSYVSKNCQIGVVIGTGFNAAYWEDWQRVGKLAPDKYAATMMTIVNTEIGGMHVPLKEIVDNKVDQKSDNPGKQLLEKRTSGMYMERMFQVACNGLDIARDGYSAKEMSVIEGSMARNATEFAVCRALSNRSIQYVASSLAAFIRRIRENGYNGHIEVAIEGSMIVRYFEYEERLKESLSSLSGTSNASIVVVSGLAGVGAALAAALPGHHCPS